MLIALLLYSYALSVILSYIRMKNHFLKMFKCWTNLDWTFAFLLSLTGPLALLVTLIVDPPFINLTDNWWTDEAKW